jgi:hypothetical protein
MSRRMTQLPLFSAEQEAERTLQEAYDLLCHDYQYMERSLEARLEKAKVEYRKLRDERDALQAESARKDQALAMARWEGQFWKDKYGQQLAASLTGPRATPTPDALLKKLLTLAHPDKWSAGQLATALAHEITVVLNDVRTQLEGHSL